MYKYAYIYIYMVCIDVVAVVMFPCMLLVAYCMVYHGPNICAIVMCMQIKFMYKFKYVHIYVTFISLHSPSYNVAKIHFLATCAVIYDDLCSPLLILLILSSMICHYVYETVMLVTVLLSSLLLLHLDSYDLGDDILNSVNMFVLITQSIWFFPILSD